jgi:hypothetical protein
MRRMLLIAALWSFAIFFVNFVLDGLRKDALAGTTYGGSFVYAFAFSIPVVGVLAAVWAVLEGRFSWSGLVAIFVVALGMFVLALMYRWYPLWIAPIWGAGTYLTWAISSSKSTD